MSALRTGTVYDCIINPLLPGVFSRYHVDSGELLKLRLLANQRQLSAYKSVKDTE